MRTILLVFVLCAALAAPASGELARVVSWDRSSVTVEINVPDPVITPIEQVGSERLSRISVAGFFP
ncbi:MAG TPA: hypothetical protein VII85_08230, partial [Candidatus Krumholzibacteriaceae bacterium]